AKSRIAVGGARGHAFEQREHASHLRDGVEGGDEMHLRCAGVAEHHVDARGHKTPDQGFAADHPAPASTSAGAGPSIAPGLRMPSGSKAALILAMSASFAGS